MRYVVIANRSYHPSWHNVTPSTLGTHLNMCRPKRVYFPFWSSLVPLDILEEYECIGFHTGSGRGGSPLQHLIRAGRWESHVRAFLMTPRLDDGETIAKKPIHLYGSLEEILIRMSRIIMEMIDAKENSEQ